MSTDCPQWEENVLTTIEMTRIGNKMESSYAKAFEAFKENVAREAAGWIEDGFNRLGCGIYSAQCFSTLADDSEWNTKPDGTFIEYKASFWIAAGRYSETGDPNEEFDTYVPIFKFSTAEISLMRSLDGGKTEQVASFIVPDADLKYASDYAMETLKASGYKAGYPSRLFEVGSDTSGAPTDDEVYEARRDGRLNGLAGNAGDGR